MHNWSCTALHSSALCNTLTLTKLLVIASQIAPHLSHDIAHSPAHCDPDYYSVVRLIIIFISDRAARIVHVALRNNRHNYNCAAGWFSSLQESLKRGQLNTFVVALSLFYPAQLMA
jgi:hypothetical protein